MLVKLMHLKKAEQSIFVTPSGITILFKLLQQEKAKPISVIPSAKMATPSLMMATLPIISNSAIMFMILGFVVYCPIQIKFSLRDV